MIRRMNLLAEAVVPAKGGQVVKFDADNCPALFGTTTEALNAAESFMEA